MKSLIIALLLLPVSAFAVDLGTFGSTYEIKERDMIEVIKERAGKVDWKSLVEKSKEDLKAKVGRVDKPFPKAPDNSSYYIDLTTTLERDIYTRDRSGSPKLLYPKGYKFNVLDYTKLHKRFVFFDATRPEETAWFKAKFASDINSMPILSAGNALEFAKEIGREAYVIDDDLIKRFELKATPTVVYQEKNKLRADEFYLKAADDEAREAKP